MSFFALFFLFFHADAKVKFYPIANIEIKESTFENVKLGGFSGAFIEGQKLYMLSDDRGRFSEPHLVVFHIQNVNEDISLKPEKIIYIESKSQSKSNYLDGEGLLANENSILISCEGDNNSKPRHSPRLFETDRDGKFLRDWEVPEEIVPEKTGLQKKGILSNSGGEGLAWSEDKKQVVWAFERPLLQDAKSEKRSFLTKVYVFDFLSKKIIQNFDYPLRSTDTLMENFKGVSEIVNYKSTNYFVLERSLKAIVDKIQSFKSEIYLVDFSKSQGALLTKEKIFEIPGDENFEALAFGPSFKGYDKTLWVINDNNFSSKEKNKIFIYGLREE